MILRKLFVTFLTLSLLGGLFLTGAMPMASAMEMTTHDMGTMAESGQPADCDQQAPMKKSSHDGLSCCLNGHCPMLAQFMPPAHDGMPAALTRVLPRPVPFTLEVGIAASPGLRPPRLPI